jgi:hypothetical protein
MDQSVFLLCFPPVIPICRSGHQPEKGKNAVFAGIFSGHKGSPGRGAARNNRRSQFAVDASIDQSPKIREFSGLAPRDDEIQCGSVDA